MSTYEPEMEDEAADFLLEKADDSEHFVVYNNYVAAAKRVRASEHPPSQGPKAICMAEYYFRGDPHINAYREAQEKAKELRKHYPVHFGYRVVRYPRGRHEHVVRLYRNWAGVQSP